MMKTKVDKVYFFQRTAAPFNIKIGYSGRILDDRSGELKTGAGCKLKTLGFIFGDKSCESELHERFKEHNVPDTEDWFYPAPEIVELVSSLKKPDEEPELVPTKSNGASKGPLDTKHATVHTMSINVKVMKIGKKQVTQAIFKQLPEQSIFEADVGSLTLRGVPWGLVKYSYKETPSFCTGYLVWQNGETLYRCPVGFDSVRWDIRGCSYCDQESCRGDPAQFKIGCDYERPFDMTRFRQAYIKRALAWVSSQLTQVLEEQENRRSLSIDIYRERYGGFRNHLISDAEMEEQRKQEIASLEKNADLLRRFEADHLTPPNFREPIPCVKCYFYRRDHSQHPVGEDSKVMVTHYARMLSARDLVQWHELDEDFYNPDSYEDVANVLESLQSYLDQFKALDQLFIAV